MLMSSMFRLFIPPTPQSLSLDKTPALPWRSRFILGILIGGFFGYLAWMFEPVVSWLHWFATAAGFGLGLAVSRVAPMNVSTVPQNVLWQIRRKK